MIVLSLLCVAAIIDDKQVFWSSILLPEFENTLHQQLFRVDAWDEIRISLKVILIFEDAL
jgi:hypothetical protein